MSQALKEKSLVPEHKTFLRNTPNRLQRSLVHLVKRFVRHHCVAVGHILLRHRAIHVLFAEKMDFLEEIHAGTAVLGHRRASATGTLS